ncbi:MAG: C4-type zinc ribbon domain-containing protein [Spirochaetota bacterium]|jgi:predicted  nucleic acid-binding Zn-ribbon protein|nr:C4-type zinc ribbon domain-containing protein [Spirochaetota bacterium]NMA56878.1 nucleic acid-binding protein [Treponema sp.]
MKMTQVFDKLQSLQDILTKKYELEEFINESPKKLSSQEELLARLKKEYIEKNSRYEEVKQAVQELKTQLVDIDASRERNEKDMDTITTHREYEVLDKAIKDATDLEQQVRKDLQKEEKILLELNEMLKQDEQLIEHQESELNAGKAILEKELESYKLEYDALLKEEEQLKPDIDPEIHFKFERIIKNKQGKGYVAVKGNVCDGCNMILPAQFANEVHAGESIVFCPYCSRILFYEETAGQEDMYFQIEDTGSLADLDDDLLFDDGDEDDDDGLEEENIKSENED